MDARSELQEFLNLKISYDGILVYLQNQNQLLDTDFKPIVVSIVDIIKLLNKFKDHTIDLSELLKWVNTIWFSDLFEYEDGQVDIIASIMTELEEADEDAEKVSEERIEKYLYCLNNQIEFSE